MTVDADFAALADVFTGEGREILDRMEQAAIALEERPSDEELIQIVFRGAHTLKGNASCLGLEKFTHAAHELENVFELLRSHGASADSQLVTLLLNMIDLFREALPDAAEGRDSVPQWCDATLEALRGWVGSRTEAAARRDPERRREGATPGGRRATDRALRVDTERLDQMINLTGELAIARGRLGRELERENVPGAVSEAFAESERLSQEIQDLVTKLRMVPVGTVFRPFVRTIRDLAAAEGKKVRLVVEGAGVEVDLSVVEHLRDPLMHMIRNAIDHGIELPEIREARGKSGEGTITLSAKHAAGCIVIGVSDDGAGIDRRAVAERGRRLGIDVDKLNYRDLVRLILEPGFSTASHITEISGRGVGLDVVRRSVEAMRGSIDIASENGTQFTLRFPLTLAIIDGFGVNVAGETYIVPLASVLECLDAASLAIDGGSGSGIIDVRGDALPVIDLGVCVGAREAIGGRHVVVVQSPSGRAGLAVDGLEGLHQTVIKPLGRLFGGRREFSGSSILSDGRVALVLDVSSLVERAARKERVHS